MAIIRLVRTLPVLLCIVVLVTLYRQWKDVGASLTYSDLKESKDMKESKEVLESKDMKESKEFLEFKDLKESELEALLKGRNAFIPVLQANVQGGTEVFLQSILTPECMLIKPLLVIPVISVYSAAPTTEDFNVTVGMSHVRTSGVEVLGALHKYTDKFDKVFINHPLGFSLDFLRKLFDMEKRFLAVTHDHIWVLDNLHPTFSSLRTFEGGRRNYAFKQLLPKLEMKSQHNATRANYGTMMDQFKSLEVVPMPDYTHAKSNPFPTSSKLVIGVIGDISWIKGLDVILKISREKDEDVSEVACPHYKIGPNYIQLGPWRFGEWDGMHMSISHEDGQTPVIFRSDGTKHYGPRKDFNTWKEKACERVVVKSGVDFVQLGSWRFGDDGQGFAFSHRSNTSHPLWQRQAGKSNVVVSSDTMELGSFFIRFTEKQLTLFKKKRGPIETFFSNGHSGHGDASKPAKGTPCPFKHHASDVQVVVFGHVASRCGSGDNLVLQPFRDIEQFNSILRKFAPSVLLVAPTVLETYSLTLTLSMLTNLPIIVRKSADDFRAAILERVRKYPRTYFHDFENIQDLVALARRVRASSCTEVSPELEVPIQWRNLMHPQLYNAVLVASKIITSKEPVSQSNVRSRYSVYKRYEQTLETITSIRANIPQSFIVLIDNSQLSKEFKEREIERLRSSVDIFVNDVDNMELRWATDICEAKQLGEAMLLLQGLDALREKQIMFRQLFKLTGRYVLNKHYDHSTFENKHNIFKLATNEVVDLRKDFHAYTCFFKIYFEHLAAFRAALSRVVSDLQDMISNNVPTILHGDLESRFSPMLPDVKYVHQLGVTLRVSMWEMPDEDI